MLVQLLQFVPHVPSLLDKVPDILQGDRVVKLVGNQAGEEVVEV